MGRKTPKEYQKNSFPFENFELFCEKGRKQSCCIFDTCTCNEDDTPQLALNSHNSIVIINGVGCCNKNPGVETCMHHILSG